LVNTLPILLITLKLPWKFVIFEHVNWLVRLLAFYYFRFNLQLILLFCSCFHLPNKCQMLTAYLDEVAHFAIWIFNAGAAISNEDKYTFSSLIIFSFNWSANSEHEVGCLFFDIIFKTYLFFGCHFGYLFCFIKRDELIDSSWIEFIHRK